MATSNIKTIKGRLSPIKDRVLVTDMDFGEQKTKGGILIAGDDGNVRGVYPRWGKVFAKGPDNKDEFAVGQWILVEHGRWTRGLSMQDNDDSDEYVVRMVEAESILALQTKSQTTLDTVKIPLVTGIQILSIPVTLYKQH